jgi:hypothetical protein
MTFSLGVAKVCVTPICDCCMVRFVDVQHVSSSSAVFEVFWAGKPLFRIHYRLVTESVDLYEIEGSFRAKLRVPHAAAAGRVPHILERT